MLVELHLLQNFAPSCLNRDDTNTPKTCEFGGYRRSRISSQCIKRAIRRQIVSENLIPPEHRAQRTKRLLEELIRRLQLQGIEATAARPLVEVALKATGLGVKEDGKTEYLLFLGEQEIARLAERILENRSQLAELLAQEKPTEEPVPEGTVKKRKSTKDKKKEEQQALPPELKKAFANILDGGMAADLGLFGRMLAVLPGRRIDAACQVAHAVSTNRAQIEMDYYTAVDDLKAEDVAGADMIGTVEMTSACFYRYANIHLPQLIKNLDGNQLLARATVEAFLRAAITAIPSGKQNSMAAHNPPSLVLAVVRRSGLWSLANAFVQPVRPGNEESMVQRSIQSLDDYWGRLMQMYGDQEVLAAPVCVLEDVALQALAKSRVGSTKQLIEQVLATLGQGGQGA